MASSDLHNNSDSLLLQYPSLNYALVSTFLYFHTQTHGVAKRMKMFDCDRKGMKFIQTVARGWRQWILSSFTFQLLNKKTNPVSFLAKLHFVGLLFDVTITYSTNKPRHNYFSSVKSQFNVLLCSFLWTFFIHRLFTLLNLFNGGKCQQPGLHFFFKKPSAVNVVLALKVLVQGSWMSYLKKRYLIPKAKTVDVKGFAGVPRSCSVQLFLRFSISYHPL